MMQDGASLIQSDVPRAKRLVGFCATHLPAKFFSFGISSRQDPTNCCTDLLLVDEEKEPESNKLSELFLKPFYP